MLEIKRFFFNELSQRVEGNSLNFMQVLLGPRQVGKSTTIRQLADAWSGPKIIDSADQLAPPKADWVEFLWQRAMEQQGICLLVIDEIQKVRDWANVLKIGASGN